MIKHQISIFVLIFSSYNDNIHMTIPVLCSLLLDFVLYNSLSLVLPLSPHSLTVHQKAHVIRQ